MEIAYLAGDNRMVIIRRASIIGLTCGALLAAGLTSCSQQQAATTQQFPEAPQLSALERRAQQVAQTGDVNESLQLFAMQFGPLPGVPIPPDSKGEPTEANVSISAVFEVWNQITAEQRAAIRQALELPESFEPLLGSTAAIKPSSYRISPAIAPMDRDLSAFQTAGRQVESALAAKLGPLGIPITYRASSRAPVQDGTPALASTLTESGQCMITIYPTFTSTAPNLTLAHEMIHCYQQRWRNATFMPRELWWVQEGSAEWAASAIVAELNGGWEASILNDLSNWTHTPGTSLTTRSYDAYGLFAFANQFNGNGWSTLRAATESADTPAAISALAGSDLNGFISGWATSQVQRSTLGDQWFVRGPGVPDVARSTEINYDNLGNGDVALLNAAAWANARWARQVSAETVRFTVGSGTVGAVRLPDGTRPLADLVGHAWCTSNSSDCTCPAGSPRAGEQIPRLDASTLVAAAGAGAGTTSAQLTGRSLRDECGEVPACPVGTWEQETASPISRTVVQSGGVGTRLMITADGSLTQDFSNYQPLTARSEGRDPITMYLAPSGTVTGKIAIPSPGPFTEAPVTNVDASNLSGSGYMESNRTRTPLSIIELRDMGLAIAATPRGGANRPTQLRCTSPNEIVLTAAPGVTQTYQRVS